MEIVGWMELKFGRLRLCGQVVGGRIKGAQASESVVDVNRVVRNESFIVYGGSRFSVRSHFEYYLVFS